MSKKTGYLLGILLTIIIGAILYWLLCCKPCCSKANAMHENKIENAKPEVKTVTKNAFSAIDQKSNLRFSANDNFNFKGSDFSILEPVTANLKMQIEKLANYLNNNPGKTIDITGHYTSKEVNKTAFPNLGLARANAVKNYLISNGISSKNINTYGELKDDLVPDDANIYYGPMSYKIDTNNPDNNDANAEALKKLGDEIRANPLVLYFDSASASINLTAAQREKVSKMVRYVDKTDATIQVIGHTDNTGNRAANKKLGQNRADFAKNYLVRNGISTSKVVSSSKGQDEPIANNNTEDGKAKNRRVVVTIK